MMDCAQEMERGGEEEEKERGFLYMVARKNLYTDEVPQRGLEPVIAMFENPFLAETFPMMRHIQFDEETLKGKLVMTNNNANSFDDYEDLLAKYRESRYPSEGRSTTLLNEALRSATKPRIYNVVTGETPKNILDVYENLVMKIVDLGHIYYRFRIYESDEPGDDGLTEVYNEIRAAFFLNELRYAYPRALTHHFMVVVDWFVSDVNHYPEVEGYGPYQYIVSEKLDKSLYDFLVGEHLGDARTLKATLFCIAQALEAAWATHRYIHYDLHINNVMIKQTTEKSFYRNKNYTYTRVYNEKQYRIPVDAHHNTVTKIIDFGRNRMNIPSMPSGDDKYNLYEHIDRELRHNHTESISHIVDGTGVGIGENRTWDLRRLLWDLLVILPCDYWYQMKTNSPGEFIAFLALLKQFVDITMLNVFSRGLKYDTQTLFRRHTPTRQGPLTFEEILFSRVREFYSLFIWGMDPAYTDVIKQDKDLAFAYRSKAMAKYGFSNEDGKTDDLVRLYGRWEQDIQAKIIWSKIAYKSNATTFLSDPFFDEFVFDPEDIITDDDAWMGERPYKEVLPMNQTY